MKKYLSILFVFLTIESLFFSYVKAEETNLKNSTTAWETIPDFSSIKGDISDQELDEFQVTQEKSSSKSRVVFTKEILVMIY